MQAARFAELWAVDFEFGEDADLLPHLRCMCAKEIRSGRTIRMWQDELIACYRAPFNTGRDALVIGYSLEAECKCFRVLGWELPHNVCDLYVELLAVNNPTPKGKRKLLDALTAYGLVHAWHAEKAEMQLKAATQLVWSEQEKKELLDYCAADVDADAALFEAMAPAMNIPRALVYGQYIKTVCFEYMRGIPIDADLHRAMAANWERIKLAFIRKEEISAYVYDGTTLKQDKLAALADRLGIPWPTTPSGRLSTEARTFGRLAHTYPALAPLARLISTITDLRMNDLPVAGDGFARCWFNPFGSRTARN